MNHINISKKIQTPYESNRKLNREQFHNNLNFTYLLLIGIGGILFISYIWMQNTNATSNYILRKLEIEKQNLMMEAERLDTKISELQSLSRIKTKQEMQYMEKIKDPKIVIVKEKRNYVYNFKR